MLVLVVLLSSVCCDGQLWIIPERNVSVCACAKCGSTSLLNWFYRILSNKSFVPDCKTNTYVFDVEVEQWGKIPLTIVDLSPDYIYPHDNFQRFKQMRDNIFANTKNASIRSAIIRNYFQRFKQMRDNIFANTKNTSIRLAIIRDPASRLMSAYRSKVACPSAGFDTDETDRDKLVPQLANLSGIPYTFVTANGSI